MDCVALIVRFARAHPQHMAPAPAIVVAAQDVIRSKGVDVASCSLQALKALVGPSKINLLQTTFRNKMSATEKEKYKCVKDKEERHKWMMQYVLDPEHGIARGYNMVRAEKIDEEVAEHEWMTEAQLLDILKDQKQLRMVIEGGDLEERLHELPSLAKSGVMQYRWRKSREVNTNRVTEEAAARLDADLKPSDYKTVSDHMKQSLNVTPSKRKVGKVHTPNELSHEQKALKAHNTARATAMRKAKQLTDNIVNEMDTVSTKVEKVEQNGYPAAMKDFFLAKMWPSWEKTMNRRHFMPAR